MEHITMPRGDLKNVHFTVHDSNDAEVSKGFTQITFTVKANTSSRKIVIQKKLTNGTITKDGNVYSLQTMINKKQSKALQGQERHLQQRHWMEQLLHLLSKTAALLIQQLLTKRLILYVYRKGN